LGVKRIPPSTLIPPDTPVKHGTLESEPALRPELEAALESATSELRLVAQIAAAAGKAQWRASAWLLERRSTRASGSDERNAD